MTNEEAIKVLEADKAYLYPDECYNTGAYDMAIEALKDERPQGKWLTTWDRYVFQCSCCHVKCVKYNFCPYCGADMRGEE